MRRAGGSERMGKCYHSFRRRLGEEGSKGPGEPGGGESGTKLTLEEQISAVWSHLDEGEVAAALDLAVPLAREWSRYPEAQLALAAAAYHSDYPETSLEAAARVLELVGEDESPESAETCSAARLYQARTAFRLWDLDAAEEQVGEMLRRDPEDPEAWDLLAQILEHGGRWGEAEAADRRAARLSPEVFPPPNRLGDEEVERAVREAIEELPDALRTLAEEVPVVIETLPSREMAAPLDDGDVPLPPDILGLFVGTSMTERSTFNSAETPGTIFLFKGNLERMCPDRESLIDEIVVTLRHELAHYLGFEEDDMSDLGLE